MLGALSENFKQVRERMAAAAKRAGRDPAAITLVGVTKTVAPEIIQQAVVCGLCDLGENRVQEADAKQAALGRNASVRWHLIGHLQSNKSRRAAELFDTIQSVDSAQLLAELQRHAAAIGKTLSVFIQVNAAAEPTKHGISPQSLPLLADAASKASHLKLMGLMAIPPYTEDPQDARPHFRRLRALRDSLDGGLKLSMGMSHDFEIAIEEGADVVRIGTAIFGERDRQ